MPKLSPSPFRTSLALALLATAATAQEAGYEIPGPRPVADVLPAALISGPQW